MFVRVAINIPSEKTFSYSVPKRLENEIAVGKRTLVPFGKRMRTGYILDITNVSDFENTKEILSILDAEPLFNENDLAFYQWISKYYIHPIGKVLSEILPAGIDLESDQWVKPIKKNSDDRHGTITASCSKIVDILANFPDGICKKRLRKLLNKNDISKDIQRLCHMGLIDVSDQIRKPDVILKKEKIISLNPEHPSTEILTKKQRALVDFLKLHGHSSAKFLSKTYNNLPDLLKRLEIKGFIHIAEKEIWRTPGQTQEIGKYNGLIIPNEDQETAFREIAKGLKHKRFSPHLLHGVTGSGKTEVYLNAMEEALRLNGGVIFLVPEIGLTPQLLTRLGQRFQDRSIAVLHSGISKSIRYDQWRQIQRGDISIVAGARSAIFAPVKNLRLIIVDEEHDSSYKQDDRMRYNARDLAIMKAKLSSASVVIGSATPAIQTYFNALQGKTQYLLLPSRVEEKPMPEVKIVDMKLEAQEKDKDSFPILSRSMKEAIRDTLEQGRQGLLFLNRRGFHSFSFCRDCGYVFKCAHCAVSMTYHAGENILKCHYCDFAVITPSLCPECGRNRIMHYGTGTERLEEEVKRLYPKARVMRMDSDTTVSKGSYEKILQSLDRHEIDILVGTQMIAKGHDFPDVTLVGIISADTSLNLPDFRAAERTFQLLTQASGRGGRGDAPGKVIIQTVHPDHYAIKRAKHHDYLGFYEDELLLRKSMSYPPFTRMVNLQLSSTTQESGNKGIEKLKNLVKNLFDTDKQGSRVEIIGPAEAPIFKIKGKYRWQLLLKGKDSNTLHRLTRNILPKATEIGLDIKVDVDPINFM